MIVSIADNDKVSSKDDYIVDIPGLTGSKGSNNRADMADSANPDGSTQPTNTYTPPAHTDNQQDITLKNRPWISVTWRCCRVYSRIYRNPQGTMYIGRCPKCGKQARARVGPDGVDQRFFIAS